MRRCEEHTLTGAINTVSACALLGPPAAVLTCPNENYFSPDEPVNRLLDSDWS